MKLKLPNGKEISYRKGHDAGDDDIVFRLRDGKIPYDFAYKVKDGRNLIFLLSIVAFRRDWNYDCVVEKKDRQTVLEYLSTKHKKLESITTNDVGEFPLELFGTAYCEICGKPIEFFEYEEDDEGKLYCESCFNSHFDICTGCNRVFRIDEPESDSERHLCPDCTNSGIILPYHHGGPKINFRGLWDDSNPLMGVEIEVDAGGTTKENAQKVLQIMNEDNPDYVWVMRDNSLLSGFEIITQPATLDYHYSLKDKYKQLFDFLRKNGYKADKINTCGVHVHFNRDFYKENETENIYKLITLVELHWDNIVKFSRRSRTRMGMYSQLPGCPTMEYIAKANRSKDRNYHHYAVNVSNVDTIEIRFFNGTIQLKRLYAILEFVENLVKYAKFHTMEEILQSKWEELIVGEYVKPYWEKLKEGNK